jgi:ligand-binding SRPBCC domain-containing protein
MRIFTLERRQWFDRPLPEVFAFFAEARNLEAITPSWLHFELLPPEPEEIRQGSLIDYRLRWRGMPIRWRTEISEWQPPRRFVDRQLRGPYRLWVHEHRFSSESGGTSVHDRVRYAVPGGLLVQRLVVGGDVEAIFDYRARRLDEIFAGSRG